MVQSSHTLTIEAVLQAATGRLKQVSETARLDAELLLCHALKISREEIFARPREVLTAYQAEVFESLVSKREKGEPVAYLVEAKDFWKHTFFVNKNVLVPRPDTELLVEKGLNFLLERQGPLTGLDLGTGSGCIVISLALELGDKISLIAVDKSEKALNVARKNALDLAAEKISFIQSDWFSKLPEGNKFDLIVSNPPYLSFEQRPDLAPDLSYEPSEALFASDHGLDDIKMIVKNAPFFLKAGGMLLCEIQPSQKTALEALAGQDGLRSLEFYSDLAGRCRAFSMKKA